MMQEELDQHVKECKAIIATWPEWKKGILENMSKSTCPTQRIPVVQVRK